MSICMHCTHLHGFTARVGQYYNIVMRVCHRINADIMGHVAKCYVISTITCYALTTELCLPVTMCK